MANPEKTSNENTSIEDKNVKVSVESKQKNATDRFLAFMRKSREDKKKKDIEEHSNNRLENSIDVSAVLSNLVHSASKGVNKVNMWIDAMLASSTRIRFLSLLMALTLCYFVNGGSGIATTKSIDYIDDVPVTVLCDDNYEVTGQNDTVTIQLIGDYASIQWAKVMKNYSIILDAQGKTDGNYELNYRADGFSSSLDIKVLPETCKVNVSKKQTKSFALSYMFVNQKDMDAAYILKEPQLAFLEVDVTAGETTLNRIDRVVAKIDVANLTKAVVDQDAPIVALDAMGNEIDVKFSQETVKYDLEVVTFSKVVPIRVETTGEVNSNYCLTKVTPSIQTVTIYGLEENLANIKEIVAVVNVDSYTSNSKINGVALTLPKNVTKVSEKTISVDVEIEKKVEKTINNIPITLESVPSGLQAKILASSVTSLKVSGPKEKIDALNASNLKIYIDLSNAELGTDTYELKIANQDSSITYEWLGASSIDVALTENE